MSTRVRVLLYHPHDGWCYGSRCFPFLHRLVDKGFGTKTFKASNPTKEDPKWKQLLTWAATFKGPIKAFVYREQRGSKKTIYSLKRIELGLHFPRRDKKVPEKKAYVGGRFGAPQVQREIRRVVRRGRDEEEAVNWARQANRRPQDLGIIEEGLQPMGIDAIVQAAQRLEAQAPRVVREPEPLPGQARAGGGLFQEMLREQQNARNARNEVVRAVQAQYMGLAQAPQVVYQWGNAGYQQVQIPEPAPLMAFEEEPPPVDEPEQD